MKEALARIDDRTGDYWSVTIIHTNGKEGESYLVEPNGGTEHHGWIRYSDDSPFAVFITVESFPLAVNPLMAHTTEGGR